MELTSYSSMINSSSKYNKSSDLKTLHQSNVADEYLSLKRLKEGLKDTLKQSNALNTMKAQIRKDFVATMQETGFKSIADTSTKFRLSIHDRVVFSIIYHALFKRNLKYSLSVLVAECGYDIKSYLFSEADIVSMLRFDHTSEVYQQVMNSVSFDTKSNSSKDVKLETILDFIITNTTNLHSRKQDNFTQTEDSGISVIDMVDMQLRDIRRSYLSKRDDEKRLPVKSIEEKMLSFERDCEARYRRDLELQVQYVRENEITKMKLEEKRNARIELDILRSELENEYQKRLQIHHERELDLNRRFDEKDRQFQQSLYDARQVMQQQIDDLRAKEQSSFRKIELETQGLRSLELRLKEAQASLEIHEKEVLRREQDLEVKVQRLSEQLREESNAYIKLEQENQSLKLLELRLQESQAIIEKREREVGRREADLEKKLKDVYERTEEEARSHVIDTINSLTKQNAELSKALKDFNIEASLAMNEEIQALSSKLKDTTSSLESDRRIFSRESDLLNQQLSFEKSKSVSWESKCNDLEKKNTELKSIISNLHKTFKDTIDKDNPGNYRSFYDRDRLVRTSRSSSIRLSSTQDISSQPIFSNTNPISNSSSVIDDHTLKLMEDKIVNRIIEEKDSILLKGNLMSHQRDPIVEDMRESYPSIISEVETDPNPNIVSSSMTKPQNYSFESKNEEINVATNKKENARESEYLQNVQNVQNESTIKKDKVLEKEQDHQRTIELSRLVEEARQLKAREEEMEKMEKEAIRISNETEFQLKLEKERLEKVKQDEVLQQQPQEIELQPIEVIEIPPLSEEELKFQEARERVIARNKLRQSSTEEELLKDMRSANIEADLPEVLQDNESIEDSIEVPEESTSTEEDLGW